MANGFNPLASFQQGLALRQGVQNQERQNQLNQLRSAIGQQASQAGFDPSQSLEMQQLAALDPTGAARSLATFQAIGQDRQKAFFQDARKARRMLDAGDTSGFLNLVETRLAKINAVGGDPSDTMAILNAYAQGDTQGVMQSLANVEQAGIELGMLADTRPKPEKAKVGRFKSQVLGNELVITDSVTGDIVATRRAPQSRKQELEQKKLEAQVKKAESEAEIKALTAETNDQKKAASLDMASEAARIARSLANNQNLSRVVGTVDAMTPILRSSSQDMMNDALRLESLLTVDNLKLMSGVLTDRDIKFLTRVGSGLNISDTGIRGSEQGVRRRLNEIADKIDGALGGVQTTPSQQVTQQQTQESPQVVNWNDL